MTESSHVILENVTKAFGSGPRRSVKALEGVSYSFLSNGPAVGIVGESGSGKSTLARLAVGLIRPTSGTVTYNGTALSDVVGRKHTRIDFRRAVQFVGQDTTSSFDPRRTLRDAVRTPAMVLRGLSRDQADMRVDEVLGLMGLPAALANRHPDEVSGGQRQRFAIARGLVVGPRLLICDEVVSALDVSVQGSILNLLKGYCRDQRAGMIFVSHSLPAAAFIADELLVMYRGRIVDGGPTAAILRGAENHPYTEMLLEAYRGKKVGVA